MLPTLDLYRFDRKRIRPEAANARYVSRKMGYSDLEFDYIFDKTGGHCFQCWLALSDASTSVAACCIECAQTNRRRVSLVGT